MAFVLSDYEFERICERSELTCGHNCRTCEAFQANQRYHNWDEEEDEDEDWDDGQGTHWQLILVNLWLNICDIQNIAISLHRDYKWDGLDNTDFSIDSTRDSLTALHYTKELSLSCTIPA